MGNETGCVERPIGVLGAMDVEIAMLRQAMTGMTTETHGDTEYAVGTVGDKPCIVARCGVGMVNAAACTQALIDRFCVRCIVNTGVAGSLSAQAHRGDLVVASDAVNWMMDVQNLGYAPGQTPGAESPFMRTSPALNRAALSAADAEAVVAHQGRVASGDCFVRDAEEREHIARTFSALCCEMEGAAIAQVCQASDVPCAILRVISDNADGTDATDYAAFEATAAERCARITLRMISLI